MTSADSSPSKQGTSSSGSANTKETTGAGLPPINWKVVVPIVLIGAVILLLGLPLGAVWIMSTSSCCFAEGGASTLTFWAASVAGFLTLFGMLITGAYIITAFRVDATARVVANDAARTAADKAVTTYLKRYKKHLFEEMEKAKKRVKERAASTEQTITEVKKTTETLGDAAKSAITSSQNATTEAAQTAQQVIRDARQRVEEQRDNATAAINAAQKAVEDLRGTAVTAINGAQETVEGLRDTTVKAINEAGEAVETAATAAQERIDQATRDLPPTEDDPSRPDE